MSDLLLIEKFETIASKIEKSEDILSLSSTVSTLINTHCLIEINSIYVKCLNTLRFRQFFPGKVDPEFTNAVLTKTAISEITKIKSIEYSGIKYSVSYPQGEEKPSCFILTEENQLIKPESILAVFNFIINRFCNAVNKFRIAQDKIRNDSALFLLENALTQTESGILIVDAAEKKYPVVYINDAYEKISGFSKVELKGKECKYFNQPFLKTKYGKIIYEILNDGKPEKVLIKDERKDGTSFWAELRIAPLKDSADKTLFYSVILDDVTLKVEEREQLKKSNLRVTALIQNLNSGILLLNSAGEVEFINNAFLKLFKLSGSIENYRGKQLSLPKLELEKSLKEPANLVEQASLFIKNKNECRIEEVEFIDGKIFELDYIPVLIDDEISGNIWQFRDITSRIITERKIIESEKNIRSIVDNTSDLIYRTTPEGKFTFVNRAMIILSGYSEEELLKMNFTDVIREDYVKKVKIFYFRQFLQKEELTYLEFPAFDKAGKEIWIGQNVKLLFENSKVTGMQAVSRDITERVFLRNQVDQLRKFYENILFDLPGQIAVYDSDFRYLYVNYASIKNDEIRAWIIGKNDTEYCEFRGYDSSVAKKRNKILQKVKDEKKIYSFEETQTNPEGVVKKWRRVIHPILDESGELKYIIGYGIDVSDLRATQEGLLSVQKQLSSVLDTVGEGIISVSATGQILMVNSEVEKLWGYFKDDLLNKNVLMLFEEFSVQNIFDSNGIPQFSHDILGKRNELIAQKKEGEFFPVEILIRENFTYGGITYTIAASDISERKAVMEELLKAKQLAEQSTKAKEQFLAHMSHEIRTPMNAVLGITNLLLELEPRDDQTEFLKAIKYSTDNLLVIINDILDFSKIEANKFELVYEQFNIKETVDHVFETVKYLSTEKSLSLEKSIQPEVPEILTGDQVRLSQILLNLLSNAVKFTEFGFVKLIIEAISESDSAVNLKFTVEDTGSGINSSDLDKIFDSFEQSQMRRSAKLKGTGLGLAIVKRLVELQGGRIAVESEINKGSKFSVFLPFHIPTKKEREDQISEGFSQEDIMTLRFNGIKILLAEDNEMNQMVAVNTLRLWGAEIEVAENGLRCFELLEKKDFDLILMDISMPVMNGYETSRKIRNETRPEMRKIPIIAFTASAMISTKEKFYEYGMNDFVAKPFRPEELKRKIYRLLKAFKPDHEFQISNDNLIKDSRSLKAGKIDRSYMEELFGDDPEAILEVISLFKNNSKQFIKNSFDLLNLDSLEELRAEVHRFKPSVSYVGAHSIYLLFDSLEELINSRASRETLQIRLKEAVAQLEVLLDSIQEE